MAEGSHMDETKPVDELRPPEREEHDRCPVCGASSDQFRQLIDIVSQSVTEAVRRIVSQGQGLARETTDTAGDARRQSPFVSDEQRLADRVAAGLGENHQRLQWSNADNRGRGGQSAG